jgi:hypothetical protein
MIYLVHYILVLFAKTTRNKMPRSTTWRGIHSMTGHIFQNKEMLIVFTNKYVQRIE